MTSEKAENAQDEVSVPLDPEPTVKEAPEKTPNCAETACCTCFSCFYAFLQVTSIKGGKQISSNKGRCLHIFWILFVILSFALVITILSKVFISYSEYNTVIRQNIRDVYGRDFPIVTMCSNGYFGDSLGIRKMMKHQDRYAKFCDQKVVESVDSGRLGAIDTYNQFAKISVYNTLNIHAWQNMTQDLLSRRKMKLVGLLDLTLPDLSCKTNGDRACAMEPFLNIKYRNCISLKVRPKDFNKKTQRMMIEGILLTKKGDVGVSTGDVSASFIPANQVDVFFHDVGQLPKKLPNILFSVHRNRMVSVDLGISHSLRLKTPNSFCLEDPIANTSHVTTKIRRTSWTCRHVAVREMVREKCNCESTSMPYDRWPLTNTTFCGVGSTDPNVKRPNAEMASQKRCMDGVAFNYAEIEKIEKCPKPCSERQFDAKVSVSNLENKALISFIKSKNLFGTIKALKIICKSSRPAYQTICKSKTKVIQEIYKYFRKNPNVKFEDIFQRVGSHTKVGPYYDTLIPKLPEPEKDSVEFVKNMFYLTIRIPNVKVMMEKERLVQTIWTTMAQAGGACSFLAGFTFVVIAEVIDTFVTFCRQRRS